MTKLRILNIIEDTVVDGPGLRISIYSAGCTHHCPGCHNPQSWDSSAGYETSVEEIMKVIRKNEFANITFSGGDPFFQPEAFTTLARHIKKETSKNIWCYTGYKYEQIVKDNHLSAILPYIDVLVDGPFRQEQCDRNLFFRGSRNQRLIDVPISLQKSEIIEFEYNPYPSKN